MSKNPDIAPKFIACRLSMREHCSDSFLARCGGDLYLSGFFDDNLNTFCCCSRPSIYVHGLELVPEKYPEDEEAREALNLELMEGDAEGGYYLRTEMDRIRHQRPDCFQEVEIDLDPEEEADEQVREHLQGNPVF